MPYLEGVRGYSPLLAALAVLPLSATMMPAARVTSTLASRFGARAVYVTGLVLVAAGLVVIQRRAPEGAGVDVVHGLARIQADVLRGTSALSVKGECCDGTGHDGDADAGTETVRRRQDGVLPGERDGGPGLASPDSWLSSTRVSSTCPSPATGRRARGRSAGAST